MTAYQRLPSASFSPVPGPARDSAHPDTRASAHYDIAWIDGHGAGAWDRRALPDTPEIEAAVSSFARGTILRGTRGPVAIEDLIPGDRLLTHSGGSVQIDWIGARSYHAGSERPRFYRVAAHAFGANGPDTDVILGSKAHILIDSPRCRPLVGANIAFAPLAAFEDGHRVRVIIPQGEVTVYGIACAAQEAVLADGLPIETYHPARTTARSLNRTVLEDMARLFPQLADTGGFGAPRTPYLTMSEAQSLAMGGALT
ncbi:Hint domain-containing protein [Jannaschia pohangensis]|uniref:Hint domain-containing protein n=1 Tax=Jannaschia pohangensis TaxID=390807 RepID=A0A1I3JTD6_9RHOB|nr:Hint domain-containing protein [Jannaschia pohangensis]SFI63527.1 Hint domain-containing protein [Jannaschia pohangensis]